MDARRRNSANRSKEDARVVFRTPDFLTAKHVELVLALHDVRAAVVRGDEVQLGAAIVQVLVLTLEKDFADRCLRDARRSDRVRDWDCPACMEGVPANFDLCWNCGSLHPDLACEPTRSMDAEFVPFPIKDENGFETVPQTRGAGR